MGGVTEADVGFPTGHVRGFMPKNEVPCRTLVITNYKRAQLYHHFPLYLLKKFQV
jgi:hypothetical protein